MACAACCTAEPATVANAHTLLDRLVGSLGVPAHDLLRVRVRLVAPGMELVEQPTDLGRGAIRRAPVLERLSLKQGEEILDMTREASTLRYRELYGFTHGDSRRVLQANIGRGVEIFIMGVPAEKRLPLRAYHAAMIFKNGVPVGYFEGLSLFERMERRVQEIVAGVSGALRATATVTFEMRYPPTVCDPAMAERLAVASRSVLGAEALNS